METLKLHDKYFKKFIAYEEIDKALEKIATQINENHAYTMPLFVSVLNGSFMFTADLLKKIHISCEVTFLKLSSYQDTQSTGNVETLIGLNQDLKNRTVIVLEDIIDTGITLVKIYEQLHLLGVKEIEVASLLLKTEVYKKDIKVNYVGFEVENDFLVGYGLDYNQRGRNLKDIYKIIE
jgi:hypoxanthine phosphoribosyltransferase